LKRQNQTTVDRGSAIWGILLGLIVGGLVTLFKSPVHGLALRPRTRPSAQSINADIRYSSASVIPSDPVATSLEEGRAAARRRRADLG
jgi:hypothetical protein